jgi:hypothetical protein
MLAHPATIAAIVFIVTALSLVVGACWPEISAWVRRRRKPKLELLR